MNDMNWLAVYPEIFLLLATCVVALVDLWVTDPKRVSLCRIASPNACPSRP